MNKKTLNTLLAGAVAMTVAGAANSAQAMSADKEKCYGVVKAGANDCGSADKAHSCAGAATADGSGYEWLGLPKGTCEKLVGGSLTPIEPSAEPEAKDDMKAH